MRIGFVATRVAGTDGVSLEVRKWSDVLTGLGHECFYFAGECEWPAERSYVVPEAHFKHPEIRALTTVLFGSYQRHSETTRSIQMLKENLSNELHRFVRSFDLQLLIAENALAIPMNIPLGLALTELIAETNLPTIGHHHDFAWERPRFKVTAASDYLMGAFPPILPSIYHVVINSSAAHQLALRTGATSTQVPNVMDFDRPPPEPDAYAHHLRPTLGMGIDECFILQPTRVVPRKRIERAIELARRLGPPCSLVISHAAGDEASPYEAYLREYSRVLGVQVLFAADQFAHQRGQTPAGENIYALADAYQTTDLVTYPSAVEGFGNAFLEAIYYRRPVVINMYEVFRRDIKPKGFRVIGFEDFVTDETVEQALAVLREPSLAAGMTEHNYELGRRHYSYRVLERSLSALIDQIVGA